MMRGKGVEVESEEDMTLSRSLAEEGKQDKGCELELDLGYIHAYF